MQEHHVVVDGTHLPDRQTPLSWEELIMILSTGYGIRCVGGLENALDERQNGVCSGDSLAVPFGFPYLVRGLEKDGAIEQLDDPWLLRLNPTAESNQKIESCLIDLHREASDAEQWSQRKSELRKHLERYTLADRDVIRNRFTNSLLSCLEEIILVSKGENAALFLINRNSISVRDWRRTMAGYTDIGKVGVGSTAKENIWGDIVFVPKEHKNLRMHARQALAGLLQCYQHLTDHQAITKGFGEQ